MNDTHDEASRQALHAHIGSVLNELLAPVMTQLAQAHAGGAGAGAQEILERLDRLEKAVSRSEAKETYTVEEAAQRVGRKEFTVRQWCNKGQVNGARKVHGKGRTGEWRIPHDEVTRLQNEGPLPPAPATPRAGPAAKPPERPGGLSVEHHDTPPPWRRGGGAPHSQPKIFRRASCFSCGKRWR